MSDTAVLEKLRIATEALEWIATLNNQCVQAANMADDALTQMSVVEPVVTLT